MGRIKHPALENPRRWRAVRQLVLERDGYRCRACHKAGRMEIDHIVPVVRGGDWWSVEGLQALCRGCHVRKTRGEQTKPNPERDAWRIVAERARLTPYRG